MSVSFPFFALGPFRPHEMERKSHNEPLMSLFQWYDRSESAREWDSDQLYPRMAEQKSTQGQIIYIPHVWSIVFDKSKLLDR